MKNAIYPLSLFLLFFTLLGCEDSEKDFEFPGPSLVESGEQPSQVVQEPGLEVIRQFTLQSAAGLQKFEVFRDNELFETIDYSEEVRATYTFNYLIPGETPLGTLFEFRFVLTDKAGLLDSAQLGIRVNSTFRESQETVNGTAVIRLKGRLNRDYTMEVENNYLLDSIFSVENNSVLTIEAGTTVYFKTFQEQTEFSNLVIAQGSKILAGGTADQPIVFTSDKLLLGDTPSPADWGGVVIYGRAPSNQGSVILDAGFRYGGDVPNDNSGVLRYVRIEYAGNRLENSIHALRLYGVGSGTQIDHVQVYRNYNIAFRLRGGRVNLKYISAIGHGGYGLWAGAGWQGLGQFWLFQTDVAATLVPVNYWNIARSIEMRNDDDDFLRSPRTTFTISNVTCIGNGFEEGVDNGTRRGARFRTGAIGTFQNAIITGFPNDAARVEDLDVEVLGVDMIFDNIRSFGNSKNYEQEARTVFFESGDYNVTEDPVPGISLTSFIGSEPSPFNPVSLGGFFSSAPYIGAVESASNDWTVEGEWFKGLDGMIR